MYENAILHNYLIIKNNNHNKIRHSCGEKHLNFSFEIYTYFEKHKTAN